MSKNFKSHNIFFLLQMIIDYSDIVKAWSIIIIIIYQVQWDSLHFGKSIKLYNALKLEYYIAIVVDWGR